MEPEEFSLCKQVLHVQASPCFGLLRVEVTEVGLGVYGGSVGWA